MIKKEPLSHTSPPLMLSLLSSESDFGMKQTFVLFGFECLFELKSNLLP